MIWAQLIGIVGVLCLLATFQFNKRRTILRLQMLSGLVWTVHYLLLGAATGASMNFMVALRNFLFDRYRKKQWIFWMALSTMVVAVIITWRNWTSILPLIGTILGTVATWQKKPRAIRLLTLLVPPFWFTYNLLNGSYPGMLGDSITFCSALIGIYRFDIAPRFRSGKAKIERADI